MPDNRGRSGQWVTPKHNFLLITIDFKARSCPIDIEDWITAFRLVQYFKFDSG
ncbi:hypothetical protein PRJ_5609 (plasmid) [Pseudomonas sp. XWY-1]|nr:hypothetical protein PRJ_5609 [Pseudomonas sp. XWY-1]